MLQRTRMTRLAAGLGAVAMGLTGCGGLLGGNAGDVIDQFNAITVEVVNDTDFFVAPQIFYADEEPGFFDSLFGNEGTLLDTGLLAPGDAVVFRFPCRDLGAIFSGGAEQIDDLGTFAIAADSRVLVRGDDFGCADTIQFYFIGNEIDFGVVVTVNELVVD